MHLNKRGVALLQVLIISAILAGISAMILRATLARQVTARQTRRAVKAQMVIEYAMSQINFMWAAKTPKAYAEHLDYCALTCLVGWDAGPCNYPGTGSQIMRSTTVSVPNADGGPNYEVKVEFVADSEDRCKVTYTILNADDL